MEEKVNVWKANLNNGLIMAFAGIAYTLVMYFLDLTLNQTQGYVFILIQVGLLYYFLKTYRDTVMHGQITYGQSVGAGVIISLYYAVIIAVFTYILYTVIDPGLITKQLAMMEDKMVQKGAPQEAIDAGMAVTSKLMKPALMAPLSIFSNVMWGTVLALVVSIFIKKEGNPLIDSPAN